MIDLTTEFGQRVARRLATEEVLWLTTISSAGAPHPRPVWFWWDGETFLIYSKPDTFKLAHIAANPKVALNFNSDDKGGDIVVFSGQAGRDPTAPVAHQMAAYAAKYKAGFEQINMSPETFGATFSVALRVTPTALRGH